MDINTIFGYISTTSLFGIMPLDIICHFLVGLTIGLFLVKLNVKLGPIFVIILAIALGKEYYDSFTLGNANTILEKIKDVFFTIIPLALIFLGLKAKADSNSTLYS